MLPRSCDICGDSLAQGVTCPDHLEMSFHERCFRARESVTGFGCPKCEAEENERET